MESAAQSIEMSTGMFAYTIQCTPADKLSWKPIAEGQTSAGRDLIDMTQEVVGLNTAIVGQFTATPMTPPTVTADNAVEVLLASGKVAADVVRTLTPEQLDATYDMGWAQLKGSFLVGILSFHASYHNGQANYIQTLYGDMEFHMPPGFMD